MFEIKSVCNVCYRVNEIGAINRLAGDASRTWFLGARDKTKAQKPTDISLVMTHES